MQLRHRQRRLIMEVIPWSTRDGKVKFKDIATGELFDWADLEPIQVVSGTTVQASAIVDLSKAVVDTEVSGTMEVKTK